MDDRQLKSVGAVCEQMGGVLMSTFVFPKRHIGQIWYIRPEYGMLKLKKAGGYGWELWKSGDCGGDICLGLGTSTSYQDTLQSLQLAIQCWIMVDEDIGYEEQVAIDQQISQTKRQIGFRPNKAE